MNFLITGAAGFLGSSLANQLAREGHQVRGMTCPQAICRRLRLMSTYGDE
jgi:nucleoside-diphosphate-sugar epimerase